MRRQLAQYGTGQHAFNKHIILILNLLEHRGRNPFSGVVQVKNFVMKLTYLSNRAHYNTSEISGAGDKYELL